MKPLWQARFPKSANKTRRRAAQKIPVFAKFSNRRFASRFPKIHVATSVAIHEKTRSDSPYFG